MTNKDLQRRKLIHFLIKFQKTTLGDWLEDSGWSSLLTDVVASSGKAESFLSAGDVTRTRYAHQVTAATLHILMTKAYQKDLIEVENTPDFKTWRKEKESNYPQFYYWSQTLRLQLLVMSFVRSIRTGDFNLYKVTIAQLLPWFFALNHTHYARWLSVHLCDMLQLKETNPDVFNHFNEGHFVITKSKRAFSSIGIDHAHEQDNKCVKGDGGKKIFIILETCTYVRKCTFQARFILMALIL